MEGIYESYYKNGQLERKCNYLKNDLDGVFLEYYKNGQYLGRTTTNYSPNPGGDVTIGGVRSQVPSTSLSEFANSTVNIVRLYNRVLSSAEILQNFNSIKTQFGL